MRPNQRSHLFFPIFPQKAPQITCGAYCGHLDGRPNGWGENYRTGEKSKWLATGHVLTYVQKADMKSQATENKRLGTSCLLYP